MKKSYGIVRRIDDLGRLVIPMEIRRDMGISVGDPMEILKTDEGILIRLYPKTGSVASYTKNLEEAIREQAWMTDEDRERLIQKVNDLKAELKAIEEGRA